MPLSRERIERLLPHRGAMCLLDEVIEWAPRSIRCAASSHRDPANPLRGPLGLSSMAGIEYGAQAMALHGALSAGATHALGGVGVGHRDGTGDHGSGADHGGGAGGHGGGAGRDGGPGAAESHGVLAAVRGVVLHEPWLDRWPEDLLVQATLVAGDAHTAMYDFALEAGARRLVGGRATVVLVPAPRRGPVARP